MTKFSITAFGETVENCFISLEAYAKGNLAIRVMQEVTPDYIEPYGVLTVNTPYEVPAGFAFVKAYSENESWAEEVATKIGGKPTGMWVQLGYVKVQLWDFRSLI